MSGLHLKEEVLESQEEATRRAGYELERERKLVKEKAKESKSLEVVGEFLRCVAYGEQDRAEGMLKEDKNLVLKKGQVTDLSNREFKAITGFQYAVWALDWQMWKMLLKYLAKEEAGSQLMEWESQGVYAHGQHASWQGLIDAYAAYYPNNYTKEYWVKQIGGGQLLLPAHVANEYCHGSRGFYPLPDFGSELALTRNRLSGGVDWYDVRCGTEWGHHRGNYGVANHRSFINDHGAAYDRGAVAALLETRLRQLEALKAELIISQVVIHHLPLSSFPTQ